MLDWLQGHPLNSLLEDGLVWVGVAAPSPHTDQGSGAYPLCTGAVFEFMQRFLIKADTHRLREIKLDLHRLHFMLKISRIMGIPKYGFFLKVFEFGYPMSLCHG